MQTSDERPEKLFPDWSWITRYGKERLDHQSLLSTMRAFGTIEGPGGALRQLSKTPYREGSRKRLPGVHGALARLELGGRNSYAGFSGKWWAARPALYATIISEQIATTLPDWSTVAVVAYGAPRDSLCN